MKGWYLIGTFATLALLGAFPFYLYRQHYSTPLKPLDEKAIFIGSGSCKSCHTKEYTEWLGSDHERAMALATSANVLGDFSDAVFTQHGITSRFYTKDSRFFVHTSGPDGKMADFEITHTFGWYPLQQYLIPFPGGRLQCLPLAWDVREEKWFHLYPDAPLDPNDWLYWTNQGQNWNSMCADCHSTNLQKQYAIENESYQTTWSEMSVGCEACHGPGSLHLDWALKPEQFRRTLPGAGLLIQTTSETNITQVEQCAYCHSRRSMISPYRYDYKAMEDLLLPRLLDPGMYYPDGQILDEVYVYGSFVQSKMFAENVRCSDCHNVHSAKVHMEGNKLCLSCHRRSRYDSKQHHFHKYAGEQGEAIGDGQGKVLFPVGSGTECIGCHMPGRVYMGNDYRPDHSFQLPRPDLSSKSEAPNSCNRCHSNKDNTWSADYCRKWYGEKKRYSYGEVLAAGRNGSPAAEDTLIHLSKDYQYAPLLRASALSLLAGYSGEKVRENFKQALADEHSIVRRTAVMLFPRMEVKELVALLGPLLSDPVAGVRIEAAKILSPLSKDILAPFAGPFEKAFNEFEAMLLYNSDFAESRLNLGTLALGQGDGKRAEQLFLEALEIDPGFATARSNLAIVYSRQGNNDLAEEQLKLALSYNDELPGIQYSLGLLLAEKKQYKQAVIHLEKASIGMGRDPRVFYNLGQLLAFLGQPVKAETALYRCLDIAPDNTEYIMAVARFHLQYKQFNKAKVLATKLRQRDPDNQFASELLDYLESRTH